MSKQEKVRKPHHFFYWFLGVIFGILLTLGLIGAGVYYLYAYMNVQKVEQMTGFSLNGIPDDLKTKTIKDIIPMVSEASSLTVEEFCEKYDIKLSFKVEVGKDELGNPLYINFKDALQPVLESKITKAFDKIDEVIDYFTISNTFALLGQVNTLPDFNFLHDPAYKDKPIQEIVSLIDDFTVGDLMETTVNLDDGVVKYIKDMKLVELAGDGGLSDAINQMKIGEILDVTTDDGVMGAIKDLTVGNLNDTNIINAIGDLTLQDVLGIDDNVEGVMATIKEITINQIKDGDIDDEIKELKISDVLTIEETSGILYELKDVALGDLTTNYIMQNVTVASALGSNETTGVIGAIGSWKLNELTNSNINNLNVGTVLNITATTGVLGAIKGLTIGDLSNETTVKNAIKGLKVSDVLSLSGTNKIFDKIKNLTLENLTDDNIISSISTLKVSDIISTTNTSTSKIWSVIANCQIGNIGDTIDDLTLSQVVEFNKDSNSDGINDTYTGLLAYLIDLNNDKDPKISELSTEIDATMNSLITTETIGSLVDNGILDASYKTATHYNSIKDLTIAQALESLLY